MKTSIYKTAKLAKKWNPKGDPEAQIPELHAREDFDLYAAQNFLSLLRALKREHLGTHSNRKAETCPTCKLIKRTEGMK